MPEFGPGPEFLKQKYDLHNSPEVESAARRTEIRSGESLPHDAETQIQNYIDRVKEITERENHDERDRLMSKLKDILHDKYVIKPEQVPESAFLLEQRIAREQGHGDVEITDEFKERKTDQIIGNQTQSMDRWVDYLISDDAQYPDWAKYWAFRSVLGMGKLQKEIDETGREKASFAKRTRETVASFPSLNQRALALTIGVMRSHLEEKIKPKQDRKPVANESKKLTDEDFQKLLTTENFTKIYGQFLIEIPEYSTEGLQETRGEWVTYPQGSDPTPMVKSFDGHPLEWCIADQSTAQDYIEGGDFYVYYSINESGEANIPRVAIRMQESHIAEVRGIAPNQNIDPYIAPIIDKKMEEFGAEGKSYEKKSADMARLTYIENIVKTGQELGKDDLIFLYEINSKIEGFGYQRDPRIDELRSQRNPKEDVPIVLECNPEDIAWSQNEIQETTKAYVGEWNTEVFQKIRNYPHIEHFYESFPEKKIFMQSLETNPAINSAEAAKKALIDKNDYISYWGEDILYKTEFSKESQKYDLVRFTVAQLGYPNGATTDEIYTRAAELGLELCPAEVGPHLRLQYRGREWMLIAMKQIADRGGRPFVFSLRTSGDQLALDGDYAYPSSWWNAGFIFVFRFRKVSQEA